MPVPGALTSLGLFVAGVLAGAVNSVAGGGSLISFPSLVASGLPAIVANATNTAAIWPGRSRAPSPTHPTCAATPGFW